MTDVNKPAGAGARPEPGVRESRGERPCLPAWAMIELCRKIAAQRAPEPRANLLQGHLAEMPES